MIFATNNEGKLRELKSIFGEENISSLKENGIFIDINEDQNSFYGNALKKAKVIYEISKQPVIADDSGLCIDLLDGFPGVYTHRFLGKGKTDAEINDAIINKCKELKNKKAKVICCLVYYDGEQEIVVEGKIYGNITNEPRGTNGFGFDPIFELENGKTLAELDSADKNSCSARYLAAKDLLKKLQCNKVKKYSQK